jgi:hypothetical protein
MKFRTVFITALIMIVIASFSTWAMAQQAKQEDKPADSGASPEMEKLAKALGGDWDSVESMEQTDFFPNGGSRHGSSHIRLTTGGTTLLEEGSSNGSAGELQYQITIWWDKDANLYRFFTCFKDSRGSSCRVRGTAHWESDTFVNDFETTVRGKITKMRDSFTEITPKSYVLVAAIDTGDGKMKTLITTRNTRR